MGRTYGGASLDERIAKRRRQFLDAGLQVFGTVGYHAATVRVLCREAGLTDRYFYESFGCVEDLLVAVYTTYTDSMRERVLRTLAGHQPTPPSPTLVHAALDALYVTLEDRRIVRVCWLEIHGVSERVTQLYLGTLQEFARLMFGLARSLYPHWQATDDELKVLTMGAVGAVSNAGLSWMLGEYRIDRKVLVDTTANIILGAIARSEALARKPDACG